MKKALMLACIVIVVPALAGAATLTRPLSMGSRGDDVTALQQVLISLGYLKVEATGYFGTLTKKAVATYQQASGLEPVGSVGPKTRALINASIAGAVPPPPSTTTPVPPPPTLTIEPLPVAPTSKPAASTTPVESGPDITPPVITVVAPPAQLPYNALDTTLTIDTDEPANCRWGTNPNMLTGSMKGFSNTGGMRHTHIFTNLARGSLYVYYVRCEDARLNTSADTQVSFSVQATSSRVPGRQISYALQSQTAAAVESISLDSILPVLTFVFPVLELWGY